MNGIAEVPARPRATAPKLTVLVVDDTASNRQMLAHFLSSRGYLVIEAADGAQAVEMFRTQPMDLVLMDVMMPVMDGLEATRRIKALSRSRWVPVVFLTALDNNADLVKGLEAGGDDYLTKPINFVVLQAKLRALSRALSLQASVVRQAESLREYRIAREAEDELAKEIAMRQVHRPGLADPQVRYWLVPTSQFSGDQIAAYRRPDGSLYAMVADATGHGLPAAVSAMPALALFYSLAERDQPIDRMVWELNNHLAAIMPTGRYLCAVVICLSADRRHLQVWNGGMPDALVLDAAGGVTGRCRSRHMPLGILESGDDLRQLEEVTTAPGGRILLTTDGILEATNSADEQFGYQRLETALASAPASGCLEAVQDALVGHIGSARFNDDVALLLLET